MTDSDLRDSPDGIAGRSARAEYERRVAKREAQITERFGTGIAAKVVRGMTTEPSTTKAWGTGAAGEARLAAELAKVDGIRVLHDRRVPRTRGNIDHIVVAPAGVFVVDAKANRGGIAIKNRGWFLRPDYRLTVGGRDCSPMADGMEWQVAAVRAVLDGVEPTPSVTPVLCSVEAEFPLLGAPDEFRGVRLESPRSLKRLLGKPGVAGPERVTELADLLARRLPPK